jgi:CBS domain-containing protein
MVRIGDQFPAPPVTVGPDQTVQEVASRMVEASIGAVAVVDREGKLLGVFSERDYLLRVALSGADPRTTPVRHVMTENVAVVAASEEPRAAVQKLLEGRFRHVPVVDPQGRVIGMLSSRDVLRREIGRLSSEIESLESFLAVDGPGG